MFVIQFFLTLLLIQANTVYSIKPRISNGLDSFPNQFAFMASIQLVIPPSRNHHHECAGTAIDKHWLLSSGECAVKIRSNRAAAMAYIGMHFTEIIDDSVQKIQIDDAIPHEHFDGHQNDISVIKLATAIINAIIAKLPEPRKPIIGELWMMGWGRTSAALSNNIPEVLQYAYVDILDTPTCQRKIRNLLNLQDSHICTHVMRKPITGCKGDFGGPLIVYEGYEPEVVGILSCTVEPCGQVDAPTVSSRVSYFITWINEKLGRR